MSITIKRENGKWLVNGKPYNELNFTEQKFLNQFFIELKLETK
jgi:hypothetical protein